MKWKQLQLVAACLVPAPYELRLAVMQCPPLQLAAVYNVSPNHE